MIGSVVGKPTVERLQPGSDLTKGLAAPLSAALQALDEKKGDVACGQLGTFAQQVQAQSGKGLTTDQANGLLAVAQRLKAQAGCP